MQVEKQSFKELQLKARTQKLSERVEGFKQYKSVYNHTYMRTIVSEVDREVVVQDHLTGEHRRMLMFASNNYLGLANHPYIAERVRKAIEQYGCGIGGPPLLNGYSKLMQETEERLADLKGQQSAMVFSSGFLANIGLMSALAQQEDLIIYDELSHASLNDGLKLSKAKAISFPHNDVVALEALLIKHAKNRAAGSVYVCVEGVYSMDGDIAPLDVLSALCAAHGAMIFVDDAHGTGVLGEKGSGTASHLKCSEAIDVTMGTFSKSLASCGGFLAASKDLIDYLRFNTRSYIFSAAIPPPLTAMVLGGIEVMANEPWLQQQLLENVKYAIHRLEGFGFCSTPEAAIIALKVPKEMDIKKAAALFHQKNIFLNAIIYPAVPLSQQRFRISMMATHTKADIDRLGEVVEEVWNTPGVYLG